MLAVMVERKAQRRAGKSVYEKVDEKAAPLDFCWAEMMVGGLESLSVGLWVSWKVVVMVERKAQRRAGKSVYEKVDEKAAPLDFCWAEMTVGGLVSLSVVLWVLLKVVATVERKVQK